MKFAAAPASALRRARVRDENDENRLVPLINVVFLMLIFFLLVGTIRSPLPQSVVPPASSAEKARVSRAVTVTIDEKLQVYINGTWVDPSEFAAIGGRVRALWSEERNTSNASGSSNTSKTASRRLEVRADKTLEMHRLSPIIKMLSEVGADELSLITQR